MLSAGSGLGVPLSVPGPVGGRQKERTTMSLTLKIMRLRLSTERLVEAMKLPKDEAFWIFMRRELKLHLKRTIEAWWLVFRKKDH